jgi:non-ribosomal peptide synthetase component E (peptide arylation enzyme)
MDERGYCRIEGRIKEMIIRGGENIYPREIEAVLQGHRGVAEAAVIGVADRFWGEEVASRHPARHAEPAHRGRTHRLLPQPPGSLQGPQPLGLHRHLPPHRIGKDPQGRAERATRNHTSELSGTAADSMPGQAR